MTAGPESPRDISEAEAADGIRSRLRQMTVKQQEFERHLARELKVDATGLAAMDRLLRGGEATPTEMARALGISTAAATLVIDRLEEAGHVGRTPHPSDRRKVVVRPAESSAQEAADRVQPLIEGVTELTASMTVEERAAVSSFLDRLLEIYDQAIAGGGPR